MLRLAGENAPRYGVDIVRGLLPETREFGSVEHPFSSTRTHDDEYLSTMLACMEMVASGTTLYCDTGQSFYLEAMVEAIETVGMRGMPGYFLADERIPQDRHYDRYFSPTQSAEACLEKLEAQIRRYPFRGDGRVRCVAALQGSGTASDALLVGAKKIAEREKVPMITHLSLKAGMCVALGSDGWSSKHDVTRQAYLAANLFNEFRNEVPTITAETALEMATVHGARALGMQDEVGSIATGYRADIVVHRRDRPGPLTDDPVPHLIYYAQSSTVDTVFVEGEAILDGGRFTRFDSAATIRRMDKAAGARAKSIGPQRGTWPIRH